MFRNSLVKSATHTSCPTHLGTCTESPDQPIGWVPASPSGYHFIQRIIPLRPTQLTQTMEITVRAAMSAIRITATF